MAGFASVAQALVAVESLLKRTIPADLGKAALLASGEIKKPSGNTLGLWVHRLTVDLNGRNRFLSTPPGSNLPPRPELPINVHFLLMSWGVSGEAELKLHAWGMQQLMATPELDISHLSAADPEWGTEDTAQIVPEEMATEDLLRIWDALPTKYTLSSSWILRTVRVALPAPTGGPPVTTRLLKAGSV
jgi:Pvc16 N-terminal domain